MYRSRLESKDLDCTRIKQQADLASRASDNIIADRETNPKTIFGTLAPNP